MWTRSVHILKIIQLQADSSTLLFKNQAFLRVFFLQILKNSSCCPTGAHGLSLPRLAERLTMRGTKSIHTLTEVTDFLNGLRVNMRRAEWQMEERTYKALPMMNTEN